MALQQITSSEITDGTIQSGDLAAGVAGSNLGISGTSILKGNGSGGISNAAAGTDYQAVLQSGTNIKTINSTSLLGSGDINTTPYVIQSIS